MPWRKWTSILPRVPKRIDGMKRRWRRAWDYARGPVEEELPEIFPPPHPGPIIAGEIWGHRRRRLTGATPFYNYIVVAKFGGDYDTIGAALDSIVDASSTNPYVIILMPGVYDEQVTMKEYVALVGLDRDVCIIESADYGTLLTMADHSSLNEIQVRSLAASGEAVYINQVSDVLIDSCIIEAEGNSNSSIYAVNAHSSGTIRLLGSEIKALNVDATGSAYGVYCYSSNAGILNFLIANCSKIEIPSTCGSQAVAVYLSSANYAAMLRLLHSHVIVDNSDLPHGGLRIAGSTVDAHAYVEHTTIRHTSEAGGGTDLYIDGSYAIAYMRADRYSTWTLANSGQIIPLAGDKPRLAYDTTPTDFTITAAAQTFQTNPNLSVTIDLPCESDLHVEAWGAFYSDTGRDQSCAHRVLLDGSTPGASTGYLGEPNADCWVPFGIAGDCFPNVAAGSHTIELQHARNDAGDTVVVANARLLVHSVPWP